MKEDVGDGQHPRMEKPLILGTTKVEGIVITVNYDEEETSRPTKKQKKNENTLRNQNTRNKEVTPYVYAPKRSATRFIGRELNKTTTVQLSDIDCLIQLETESGTIECLVDSGAQACCVSLDLVHKLGVPITQYLGKITTAGQQVVSPVGIATIPLKIGERKYLVKSIVLQDLGKCDMLIGTPLLRATDSILSLEEEYLFFKKENVKAPFKKKEENVVKTVSEVILPARSQIWIDVKFVSEITHESFFTPYAYLRNSTVRAVPGVMGVGSNKIMVGNFNDFPITVAEGAEIGMIEKEETLQVQRLDLEEEQILFPITETEKNNHAEFEKKIDSSISLELSAQERKKVSTLLRQQMEVFAENPKKPGATTKTTCTINTKQGAKPIKEPPRRVSPSVLAEQQKQVEEMERNGIVIKSRSPWAFPVVMVRKGDGSLRFCVDYRRLNDITVKDAYPLPRIDDTLQRLQGAKVFTTIDLASGYWQIPMDEEARKKSAFTTPFGTFEWTVMPFGLTNAPAEFQRAMNETLGDLVFRCCLVYIDDIIIYSKSFGEHEEDVGLVLEALKEFNWKLKLQKCHFFEKTVRFLGHIISEGTIRPDPDNVEPLRNMDAPKDVKGVMRFLGTTGYYRDFIEQYAQKAEPLVALLRKGTQFEWLGKCQRAFESLRDALLSAPLLRMADMSREFIVKTDASKYAIGGRLVQIHEGIECTVSCFSATLNRAQRSWPAYQREAYAVVRAITHWDTFLNGGEFLVISDQQSLTRIFDMKQAPPKVWSWVILLSRYAFQVKHRPGTEMAYEDMLSRDVRVARFEMLREEANRMDEEFNTLVEEFVRGQRNDLVCREIKKWIEQGTEPKGGWWKENLFQKECFKIEDGLLFYFSLQKCPKYASLRRLIAPENLKEQILQESHDSVLAGHFGFDRTYARLCESYWWPSMYNNIKDYVRSCEKCQKSRRVNKKPRSPLHQIGSSRPMEIVGMDHLGPFQASEEGYNYVLVLSDYFSRYVWCIPTRSTAAEETAEEIVKLMLEFGFCSTLLSDNGTAFHNRLQERLERLTNMKRTFATAKRPQTMGLVEKFNETLAAVIRKNCDQVDHHDWHKFVKYAAYAYNSSFNKRIGKSPCEVMFGRRWIVPGKFNKLVDIIDGSESRHLLEEWEENWKSTSDAHEEAMGKIDESHTDRLRKTYEPVVGDVVWLLAQDDTPRGLSEKLDERRRGPYDVLEVQDKNNVVIQITARTKKRVHVEQIEKYIPRELDFTTRRDKRKGIEPELDEVVEICNPEELIPEFREDRDEVGTKNIKGPRDLIGRRITVYWPSFNKWCNGTVIGMKRNQKKSLIFYDERTSETPIHDDYFQDRLFGTNCSKWWLLRPREEEKFEEESAEVDSEEDEYDSSEEEADDSEDEDFNGSQVRCVGHAKELNERVTKFRWTPKWLQEYEGEMMSILRNDLRGEVMSRGGIKGEIHVNY